MSENKEKYFGNYIIKLSKPDDIAFSNMDQNAVVTGATLPSGFKVSNSGKWVVKNDFIVDKETLLKLGFKEV